MKRHQIQTVWAIALVPALSGCGALIFKGVDEGSQRMAREESAEQEANESAGEHLVEETGKTIQKGVQPINKAKRSAVDAVKGAVD
ncbi:hypothetical protein ACFQY0_03590 [Haloferula chungangensis]|uniref:Lipoprotein n=1 Tax=Haloferula chungangensis TaxID=1048331 RepID=A0ABW2L3I8_9BACT